MFSYLPPVSLTPMLHLKLEISSRIFEKCEMWTIPLYCFLAIIVCHELEDYLYYTETSEKHSFVPFLEIFWFL